MHASAGFAALASVIYLGKRRFVDTPHNIPFIALGTGLLWFGWYGFNAGQRAQGRPHHRARVPQHRPRRLVRGGDVAVRGVVVREEAALRRAPDGRGRGVGDDHAGRRLRADLLRAHHRHRGGGRLLRSDPAQEQAQVGRRARRLGSARCRRPARDHPPRRLRLARGQPERRQRPDPRLRARSSGSRSPRGSAARSTPSSSRT